MKRIGIQYEFQSAVRGYRRSGSKKYRQVQIVRMAKFIRHCQNMGCTRMEQIGKRHRMSFAASLKHFAPKTQHDYRLAVDKLMELHRSSHLNLQPYKQGKTPTSRTIPE